VAVYPLSGTAPLVNIREFSIDADGMHIGRAFRIIGEFSNAVLVLRVLGPDVQSAAVAKDTDA
jgi:hypothetical protein